MEKILDPIYKNLCPTCSGDVFANSLWDFGVCGKCSGETRNSFNALTLYRAFKEDLEDFTSFFRKATGNLKPWGAQLTWVKRLLNGENTVIVAPTGMGKTTLLVVYSVYVAKNYGKKVLFFAPTRALAKQIYNRIIEAAENVCGTCINILFYDSGLSKKRREEILLKIKNNEYDILVLTNHFLNRHYDLIDPSHIGLIVIDDVDSLMRSSKNILRLMKLLGFHEELIEKAKKRNSIIWKLMLSKSLNKEEDYRRYIEELIEIEAEIDKLLRNTSRKQVVIASATGRMKGTYAKVMRDLLRIDVSGITVYGRNITDTYLLINDYVSDADNIIEVIKILGPGALIFISPRHPLKKKLLELVKLLREKLEERGYRVAEANPSTIKKFIRGEYDFLIGSSSYYGVSVRGIDAPETIKYVLFIGTPLFTVELGSFLASPNMLIRVSLMLSEVLGDQRYRGMASAIRRLVFPLNSGEIKLLSMLLKNKITINDLGKDSRVAKVYEQILGFYNEIRKSLEELLSKKKVVNMNTITFYHADNKFYALIPDVMTYIQASGRCSRLYLGRMTHGLSLVVEYEFLSNLVNGLSLKMNMFSHGFVFKDISNVDLYGERKLIEKTRRELKGPVLTYRNILVVVESPTKAKTIARFFGKPVRRKIGSISVYEIPFVKDSEVIHLNIVATRGHLFDLTTDPSIPNHGVLIEDHRISPVYTSIKRCRICGHQFTYGDRCPRCGSTSFTDSYEVVNVLRKLAQEADEVYIATDPDIEGEKIAYDVYLTIKGFVDKVWRIELHEITLNEFLNALENKRDINRKLVEAEIYRRVLDRIIGFSLSQELWRKYSKKWLGAGRVQTPVLGWIIDHYNEYVSNKCRKIIYITEHKGFKFSICIDLKDKDLYKEMRSVDHVTLVLKNSRIETFNPPPPYTTDELLYDASRIGIPSSLTMKIAQELFESGLITYHRTSYHYVSSAGISVASKYLENKDLMKHFHPSHWGNKGAHEAIRPVHPLDREDLEKAVVEGIVAPTIPLTWLHYRVYDLIFKRFISSQMNPYKALIGEYDVVINNKVVKTLVLPIEIVEDGFNIIMGSKTYSFLKGHDRVNISIKDIKAMVTSTKPLCSEGGLVKLMKEHGLGRPSTYSKIISSIVRHGYVIRSKKRGFLIPTKTGIEVYNYLSNSFPELVSIDTTRDMEMRIDLIAKGEMRAADEISRVLDRIRRYKLPLSIREVVAEASA
ncbi:reverse gyrase [Staphylothermus hellenicus]|uniref:Reverse gyrase n=1 Tax=Staphylothermus hellenicus (strain DSM 12710 / JCM 10830 / BK20S6-10-b1 / P8) TaxID=591019 RepID=D7D9Z0_STAHD|nr:reverse gyrase [Staphylothermus hellenicus]ADI32586.1 DNA topoisomerase (ATP-hydrolyzing) [Staphylothermus hellenicus DSM 12710]